MPDERRDAGDSPEPVRRKPYRKPVLQIYGDLGDITQSMMGMMAMNDGSGHANKHFTA
jgi:hypothetical protein